MARTERVVDLLRRHEMGGSVVPQLVRVEWTPEPASNCSIRSTWKDAKGKPLTNRRITMRQREGWYGETAKRKALSNIVAKEGVVFRCSCGAQEEVRYLTYSYLTAGYYCPLCLAKARADLDKEKALDKRFKELSLKEYV